MVSTLELFGTFTSPYVRRTRVIAMELGLPLAMRDTATPEGQEALRAASPLWKVPALRVGDQVILDSDVIGKYLLRTHGPGPLAAHEPSNLEVENFIKVVDGALDSLINAFYLAKEGVTGEQAPYLAKQRARAASALTWADGKVGGSVLGGQFGLAAIGLATALEWMVFREAYPVADHPALCSWLAAHAERPSLVATRPPQ